MELHRFDGQADGPVVRASRIAPADGAVEAHVCITPGATGDFARQLTAIEDAYESALEAMGLPVRSAVLRRIFLSDSANQESLLADSVLARPDDESPFALSVLEQPPLPDGRIALWAYHLHDPVRPTRHEQHDGAVLVKRDGGDHLWATDICRPNADLLPDSRAQTTDAFDALGDVLSAHQASLIDHVIRTWIFVDSVDLNYMAMVDERREIFAHEGMTSDTHYIASTGIAGRRADPRRVVTVEGYAMPGISPEQIRFLTALDRLGPTSAYGVTFERGVRIDHGDRCHLFISGTASIDPAGDVVHPRDIQGQADRTFGNIEALLADGGASLDDMAQMIVYLRDPGDRHVVAAYLEERFPRVPRVYVLAAVCRPGWLIEVECWAVIEGGDPRWGIL
jgi:enamine deaminase RidA (YjgF/YER057c/UK114 family)